MQCLKHFFIQVFRERLSEKVHATIPTGIVGGFDCTVYQKKIERMIRDVCDVMLGFAKGKQPK